MKNDNFSFFMPRRSSFYQNPCEETVFNIVSPIGATDKTRFHSDVPMGLHHENAQFTGVPPSASPLPKPLIVLTDFLADTNINFMALKAAQSLRQMCGHKYKCVRSKERCYFTIFAVA